VNAKSFEQYVGPKPTFHKRFIDDILILSSLSNTELDHFLSSYTSFYPSLTYTQETSDSSAHFLDITIKIDGNQIVTTLYTKPSNSKQYLLYNSCHPKNTLNSIPYSQFLRLKRICSLDSDFHAESNKLFSTFLECGYPSHILTNALQSASQKDRVTLLISNPKPQLDRIPLILPFHETTKNISDNIYKLFNIFRTASPALQQIFPSPPLKAFSRARNIKSILVRTALPSATTIPTTSKTISGNFPCNSSRCSTCPHIVNHSRISGPHGTFSIRCLFTCKSFCLIYAITCKKCPSIYIGQTKRTLAIRFSEHLRSIQNQNTPVGQHFSLPNHSISDIQVSGPIFAPGLEEKRLELESQIIVNLGSDTPPCLNSRVCFS